MFGESSGDLTPFPYSTPSPTAADGDSAATVRSGDGGGNVMSLGVKVEIMGAEGVLAGVGVDGVGVGAAGAASFGTDAIGAATAGAANVAADALAATDAPAAGAASAAPANGAAAGPATAGAAATDGAASTNDGGAAWVVGPLETNNPTTVHTDIGSPLGTGVVDVGVEESGRAFEHSGDTPDAANGNGGPTKPSESIEIDETAEIDTNR